jgi:molecular chaperone DnaK
MGIWDRWKRRLQPSPGFDLSSYYADGTLLNSVGIETAGGVFTRLIPRGAPLPASVTEIFTTAEPDMATLQIRPFQGEDPQAARNIELGPFEVTQLPPGRAGGPQIAVTFNVDADGAFSMTARDLYTGRDLPVLKR